MPVFTAQRLVIWVYLPAARTKSYNFVVCISCRGCALRSRSGIYRICLLISSRLIGTSQRFFQHLFQQDQ